MRLIHLKKFYNDAIETYLSRKDDIPRDLCENERVQNDYPLFKEGFCIKNLITIS